MAVSHAETGRPTRCPDPVPPSQPVTTTVPPDPAAEPGRVAATDQPDDLVYCRGCGQGKPKSERVGFRCKQCADRAKNSASRWIFNERGDLISKGVAAEPKKPLYDSEGNLIKRNAK